MNTLHGASMAEAHERIKIMPPYTSHDQVRLLMKWQDVTCLSVRNFQKVGTFKSGGAMNAAPETDAGTATQREWLRILPATTHKP